MLIMASALLVWGPLPTPAPSPHGVPYYLCSAIFSPDCLKLIFKFPSFAPYAKLTRSPEKGNPLIVSTKISFMGCRTGARKMEGELEGQARKQRIQICLLSPFYVSFSLLRIKPRVLHLLHKCSITEAHSQSSFSGLSE